MSDADAAAPVGCLKMDTHSDGKFTKTANARRNITQTPSRRAFPEHAERQAVQMRIEGASISAAARVVGASAASVSGWVKKGGR